MAASNPDLLRADALRNRTKLVIAAREVFGEHGVDAPLEDVAAAAHVTRTTLYRHFPTRADLAEEVYVHNVELIEQRAAELSGRDDGIVLMLDFILDLQRHDRALAGVFGVLPIERMVALSERTSDALSPLLAAGRQAGIVHRDVQVEDLMLVFPMVEGVMVDSDHAGRAVAQSRLRLMLHRALFTPAGWESRDA